MNKNIIAAAVLALVSGLAVADGSNVTIYGNVDLGMLSQNHVAPGAKRNTMANGGISPSIWGFRGTEDLGNGLKATFNLEGHFKPDTGEIESGAHATGTYLFRRQSNVGLSAAGMGTLTLGNQYSPAILAFAATDPRGLRENFSGLYSWAYNSGTVTKAGAFTPGGNTNHDVGVFLQNAISYSNKVGPVGIAAGYSISENKGSVYSLGATYAGPVSLSAAYQQANAPTTSDSMSKMYTVGAGYTMDAFTVKLNYLRGVNKNAALVETSKVGVIGAGVDWRTASNNTVIAAVYFGKDKNNGADKTKTLILSDEYAFSKRTTLYGQLAYADADAGASLLTTVVGGGTMANANTTLLNVGIKHSF
jgi:predicted porin